LDVKLDRAVKVPVTEEREVENLSAHILQLVVTQPPTPELGQLTVSIQYTLLEKNARGAIVKMHGRHTVDIVGDDAYNLCVTPIPAGPISVGVYSVLHKYLVKHGHTPDGTLTR